MRKWERGGNGGDRGERVIEKGMYGGGGRTKRVQRKWKEEKEGVK